MVKNFILIWTAFICNTLAFACPELAGHYGNCQSEIRALGGEYTVEETTKDNVLYYFVQKINPEDDDDVTSETIRTDGVKISRKEKIPKYGVTARIDTKSRCVNDEVVSRSEVFTLGMKVGEFTSKMSKDQSRLVLKIDGGYLNREVHKHITCEQI